MKKTLKYILRIVPISIGVALIFYSLNVLTENQKKEILGALGQVDYTWVLISIILGFLSHVLRAYRWKIALKPLGKSPDLINSILAVYSGYLINLVFPRAGEFYRAGSLQQTDDVPASESLGTIVTERLIDLVMLGIIVLGAISLQSEQILNYVGHIKKQYVSEKNIWIALILTLVLGLFFVILKRRIKGKFKSIISHFTEGLTSVLKMEDKTTYILSSFGIWGLYLLMFFTASLSFDGKIDLNIESTLTGFIAGTLSIATTNGGIGSYPLAIEKSLGIYGITDIIALSFGWVVWISQTLMTLLIGGFSFLLIRRKKS